MEKRGKSYVWKFFKKNCDGSATCNLCTKTLKTAGNTSNLMGHLRSRHEFAFAEGKRQSKGNEEECTIINADKSHPSEGISSNIIVSGSESSKNIASSSRSSVGSEFSTNVAGLSGNSEISGCSQSQLYLENDGDSDFSLKQNEKSQPLQKRAKTIKEVFQTMSDFKPGGVKYNQLINSILYMICVDNEPLSIVERKGFQQLMKTAVPLFKIPNRSTISRMIDGKYNSLSEHFRSKIRQQENISLTTDIWTDIMQTRSFLGVTVHFVERTTLTSATVGVYPLEERHTAEYLAEKLLKTCKEWNINTDNVKAIVTDNGANIVKAADIAFGKKRHIPCFAHTLNLVVEKAINSVSEAVNVISKVKDIVTWFKQSVVGSDELRKLVNDSDDKKTKLIQEVPTRWNSKFYMIQRFLELKSYVNEILLHNSSAPAMITAKEIEELEEIIVLLRPFEAATKELCGENYVTSSLVIPMIHCLEAKISAVMPISKICIKLKSALMDESQKRFGKVEQVHLLALSTILDPRFKKIHFKDALAVSKIILYIKSSIRISSVSEKRNIIAKEGSTRGEDIDTEKFSLWSEHHRLVKENTSTEAQQDDVLVSEVNLYFQSPVNTLIEGSSNMIEIWENQKAMYPRIFKMAEGIMAIPATSVPSERLFSKAGLTLTQQRNRLKGHRLSKLLFLQSLNDVYWEL